MNPMTKDPAANKDYGFDWSAWMAQGDSISTSVFSGGSCSITSSSIITSSHSTVCFIGSGTLGSVNKITNRITTAQGRTDERSFDLKIINL